MSERDALAKRAAIAAGAKHYFTGLPCKHGHVGPRMNTGHCVECKRAFSRRPSVAEKNRESAKRWAQKNPDKAGANVRAYQARHPERLRARRERYRLEHPEITTLIVSNRRARRINATPPWADMKAISAFYRARPKGYHVDHVVPLHNKLVCGLHVRENLQYLPARVNCRKSNKFSL